MRRIFCVNLGTRCRVLFAQMDLTDAAFAMRHAERATRPAKLAVAVRSTAGRSTNTTLLDPE